MVVPPHFVEFVFIISMSIGLAVFKNAVSELTGLDLFVYKFYYSLYFCSCLRFVVSIAVALRADQLALLAALKQYISFCDE